MVQSIVKASLKVVQPRYKDYNCLSLMKNSLTHYLHIQHSHTDLILVICETKALLQTGYPSVTYKKLARTSEFTKGVSHQYWSDPRYEKNQQAIQCKIMTRNQEYQERQKVEHCHDRNDCIIKFSYSTLLSVSDDPVFLHRVRSPRRGDILSCRAFQKH